MIVASVAWGATSWLLDEANNAQDRASSRIEAIKTGLSIAAGIGGVFALLLAVRRQWHQEVIGVDTKSDAEERRITELYTKAVEQLGADDASVRLGALYSLERLADSYRDHRQTMSNMLCAYLRMPFGPPADDSSSDRRHALPEREHEQLQVRMTAQRILKNHLRGEDEHGNENPKFWPDTDLNLTGATLVDFDLSKCTIRKVAFTSALFVGDTTFRDARFSGDAEFVEANFATNVEFSGARFGSEAWFTRTTFGGVAQFGDARFAGDAWFDDTVIEQARFDEAHFAMHSWFDGARFIGNATFDHSEFCGHAVFARAKFGKAADFGFASFRGHAMFMGAVFTGEVNFQYARFARRSMFDTTQISLAKDGRPAK